MIAKLDKPSDRLRYARQMRDYASAAEFAESFGFIEPTVRSHENGTRKFDEEGAKRYAKALDVPWTWLMVGRPKSPSTRCNLRLTRLEQRFRIRRW